MLLLWLSLSLSLSNLPPSFFCVAPLALVAPLVACALLSPGLPPVLVAPAPGRLPALRLPALPPGPPVAGLLLPLAGPAAPFVPSPQPCTQTWQQLLSLLHSQWPLPLPLQAPPLRVLAQVSAGLTAQEGQCEQPAPLIPLSLYVDVWMCGCVDVWW